MRLKKPRKRSQTRFPSALALFSDKLLGTQVILAVLDSRRNVEDI
ncbi:MAG: hypothetical protein ACI9FJ_001008 [Alteromonadaceae bacterium]